MAAQSSSASGGAPTPIIIKRKKKVAGEGHHGGAWKVAYADFVTAMMAFFLLLWLLNVTTSDQRKGIADYFSPASVARSTSGSGGVLGGLTITVPGALISPTSPISVPAPTDSKPPQDDSSNPASDQPNDNPAAGPSQQDQNGQSQKPIDDKALAQALARQEQQQFADAKKKLLQTIGGIPDLADLTKNLVIDQTPDGLRIQIVDAANYALFPLGGSQMYPKTQELLDQVAKVVSHLPNKLSITGHTDSTQFTRADHYGNWELSSDRANATRRALVAAGINEDRIASVIGKADQDPLDRTHPELPINRRISIVLLSNRIKPATGTPPAMPETAMPPAAGDAPAAGSAPEPAPAAPVVTSPAPLAPAPIVPTAPARPASPPADTRPVRPGAAPPVPGAKR